MQWLGDVAVTLYTVIHALHVRHGGRLCIIRHNITVSTYDVNINIIDCFRILSLMKRIPIGDVAHSMLILKHWHCICWHVILEISLLLLSNSEVWCFVGCVMWLKIDRVLRCMMQLVIWIFLSSLDEHLNHIHITSYYYVTLKSRHGTASNRAQITLRIVGTHNNRVSLG